ncbi:MAG: aspartate/glutamate racemase family protein [Pseudomonadota bacterium]
MTSSELQLAAGRSIEGYSVGILHLSSTYPLPPGNAQHAQTYGFPVAFEAVTIDDPFALMRGDDHIGKLVIEACVRLEQRGVRAIVGACGSFAYYQRMVAEASRVPVYTSVLTQVPFLLQALGSRPLGVICASASSMNQRIYDQCGIADPGRLVIDEMRGMSEFDAMLKGDQPMDEALLREQTCQVAKRLRETNPEISGIVLQCSDLPPYGQAIQESIGLPLYDAVTLINWVHNCANYPAYEGIRRYIR